MFQAEVKPLSQGRQHGVYEDLKEVWSDWGTKCKKSVSGAEAGKPSSLMSSLEDFCWASYTVKLLLWRNNSVWPRMLKKLKKPGDEFSMRPKKSLFTQNLLPNLHTFPCLQVKWGRGKHRGLRAVRLES